jgi:hypothetical protein
LTIDYVTQVLPSIDPLQNWRFQKKTGDCLFTKKFNDVYKINYVPEHVLHSVQNVVLSFYLFSCIAQTDHIRNFFLLIDESINKLFLLQKVMRISTTATWAELPVSTKETQVKILKIFFGFNQFYFIQFI